MMEEEVVDRTVKIIDGAKILSSCVFVVAKMARYVNEFTADALIASGAHDVADMQLWELGSRRCCQRKDRS
jgi:hypothetical protein